MLRTTTLMIALMGCFLSELDAATIVNFDDLSLSADSVAHADASETPFVSYGVEFNRLWNSDFDCCPSAWALSNKTDLTTAGFTNPHAAYVLPQGGGVDGSANYAVANNSSPGEARVSFPEPTALLGTYVANTTYTYLSVVDGNDGAGFVKGPFGQGDYFRLDLMGIDEQGESTGTVEFYLADYRDGKTDAVSEWTWVDLTSLGPNVSRLEFQLESTDVGDFGMNTPAYFAIDNLTLVPEPTGAVLLFPALLSLAAVRHRWAGR